MGASEQCSATFGAIFHKTHICAISLQVLFNFVTLLREVEMSDWECLHSKMCKHTSDISAGVTHGFGDYGLCKLITLANDKSVWIVARNDSVKSKVST
jgi:hypothetical protein